MVSNIPEVDDAIALINRAYREVTDEGFLITKPKVGVMIEVPSVVYQMPALAKRVDFFSIGTNDLTQYLLAVDRNNARVAGLYDSFHPAVLSVIRLAVENGQRLGKPVSVCGELAGSPMAAIPLVAMGVNSMSMNVSSLGRVKWVIRSIKRGQAQGMLDDITNLEDGRAVRRYLESVLEALGLGGLVRGSR
jgi:phosphotransferase system enzyme I (PtsP)